MHKPHRSHALAAEPAQAPFGVAILIEHQKICFSKQLKNTLAYLFLLYAYAHVNIDSY